VFIVTQIAHGERRPQPRGRSQRVRTGRPL